MQFQSYTISELANEFDITTRTIRFYEDKGLLQPVREGQKRIYSQADRVRLILILRGRRLGFSIDESKDLIELYNPQHNNQKQLEKYLQKIREKKESLARQLDDIKILQREINDAEKRCLNAMKNLK
ncbi:MerR family transcriptional regulator [Agarilytica rhodophyticola]|uniref:MerR family transcriptional regulator n=1 Tax=Agarilytica rhodophyticola TaxID=1737490 RepID=UPI000B349976|nr:MerR family DNA-binding transcriptional regulator [Agarilytica rhodophyticola]